MNSTIKYFLLPMFASILLFNSAYCQQAPDISFSLGTAAPYQHFMRLGYNFQFGHSPSSLQIYAHTGITPSPYLKTILDFSIEDNETAKEYLKTNLKGKFGGGVGIQWLYKRWYFDVGINLVQYQIKDKSSKELVESIASDNIKLRETLDNLANNSAVFSDLYNNYLISPQVYGTQLIFKGGYEFPINKPKSLKLGIDMGVAATAYSHVYIDSEKTSRLADLLINTVTPVLTDRLEYLVNWKVIPFVGVSLIYQIPTH